MSTFIPPAETISEAWLRTLETVSGAGGRLVHVLTTVTVPGAEDPDIRALIDGVLEPGRRRPATQSVETVAGTIFPADLYRDVGFGWRPDLPADEAQALNDAAADLFDNYALMLPMLLTAQGNERGTYFSRMMSWPGKAPDGVNQLADRIHYLRLTHARGASAHNASDIALGGEADMPGDMGFQVYAATDRRQRGFPCLVHVDLSLLDGRLSMLAIYRHQYLITKAYGNLVGLSQLLRFIAQQTGFAVGELAIQATLADDERTSYGGASGVGELVADARHRREVA